MSPRENWVFQFLWSGETILALGCLGTDVPARKQRHNSTLTSESTKRRSQVFHASGSVPWGDVVIACPRLLIMLPSSLTFSSSFCLVASTFSMTTLVLSCRSKEAWSFITCSRSSMFSERRRVVSLSKFRIRTDWVEFALRHAINDRQGRKYSTKKPQRISPTLQVHGSDGDIAS